ncbi:hypothetical protein C8J57DRAFT_1217138 [Mycena rebaudengoi]|nr:hypothetical protein C8J57DRAFT_1217138 [Mycena rebaudengoi]
MYGTLWYVRVTITPASLMSSLPPTTSSAYNNTEEYYSSSPFYCTPPLHPDPGSQKLATGPFYLVVLPQAWTPGNGIYVSWDSAVAATTGITGGPPKFATLHECYAPWRVRCEAGEHGHPVSPNILMAQEVPPYSATSLPTTPSHRVLIGGQPQTLRSSLTPTHVTPAQRAALETPYSTPKATVITSTTAGYHWEFDACLPPPSPPLPAPELLLPSHYAVKGGGMVHGTLAPALEQYDKAVLKDRCVGLLATSDSMVTALFSLGHTAEEAEVLAAVHRAKAVEESEPL